MDVSITEATEATAELDEAFARLVPQLSASSPPPTREQIEEIIAAPGTRLLLARLDGLIVGTLTIVLFRIPTGVRAWIEDVVVDEAASGHRIGEKLSRHALEVAGAAGAKTVELTSRPSREAANHIYRKIGFERRETNVYRFTLD